MMHVKRNYRRLQNLAVNRCCDLNKAEELRAHSKLLPYDNPFALPYQPTFVLQIGFAHNHSLPRAFDQVGLVVSAAQIHCNLQRALKAYKTGSPRVHTTSPLTASLLVSMYHRLTASVTTMLSGVRNGALSSADCADTGVWVGGVAAAGLACPLMPAPQHSTAVAFRTQSSKGLSHHLPCVLVDIRAKASLWWECSPTLILGTVGKGNNCKRILGDGRQLDMPCSCA